MSFFGDFPPWFDLALLTYLVLALVSFLALMFLSAPYGRHGRAGWGPTMETRLAWLVWESPQVLLFTVVFLLGARRGDVVPLVLLGLWQLHYVHRGIIYPLRLRADPSRRTPVLVAVFGLAHNAFCSVLNAAWLTSVGPAWTVGWLWDPRFLVGAAIFTFGFVLNRWSDAILRGLRQPGQGGYRMPIGGPFRWVSCPNYLGELLIWVGFAIAAWSPAGLAFALYTAANLVPRAIEHHLWYRRTFPGYPRERWALVPFLL